MPSDPPTTSIRPNNPLVPVDREGSGNFRQCDDADSPYSELTIRDCIQIERTRLPALEHDMRQSRAHGRVIGAILHRRKEDRDIEIRQRRAKSAIGGDSAANDD